MLPCELAHPPIGIARKALEFYKRSVWVMTRLRDKQNGFSQ